MGQEQSAPKTLSPLGSGSAKSAWAPAASPKSAAPIPSTPKNQKSISSPPPPAKTSSPSAAAKSAAPAVSVAPKKVDAVKESPKVEAKTKKSEDSKPSKSAQEAKPKSAASSRAPVLKQKTLAPVSAKSTASAPKAAPKKTEKRTPKPAPQPQSKIKKRELSDSSSDDFQKEPPKKRVEEEVDEDEAAEFVATWTEPKSTLAPSKDHFLFHSQTVIQTRAAPGPKKLDLNPLVPSFVLGAYYRRKDIIGRYKGQQMSGIVTPANARYLFIFSSAHETAASNPYVDGWRGDEFWYTGEGLKGDQKMTKGNFKIKEHVQLKRHIFLFQKAKLNDKLHRYVGEFKCQSTRVVDGMDSENKPRKEFKFILTRTIEYEALSDNEEIEDEHDTLKPERYNKHETLPGLWYNGNRPWKTYENRMPVNSRLLPASADTAEYRRPELGEVIQMGFAARRRPTTKVKSVLKATKVSTQAASRDFVPGKHVYVGKTLKSRSSVYDGTEGPEELDLHGVEYKEEPKQVLDKVAPRTTVATMKRKRQEKKVRDLLRTAVQDGLLDDAQEMSDDQSEEVEPPAKRARLLEDSE